MFFAFHLTPPAYRQALHDTILSWSCSQELTVYLEAKPSTAPALPEKRRLSEADLTWLKTHLTQAEQNKEFGGFVAGNNLTDINGLCFFELDSPREKARLVGFIINDKLADVPPLQSPLLLLPLIALLRQEQLLEKLYFPFLELSQEDFISLGLLDFAPIGEPGWWQQANVEAVLNQMLAHPTVQPVAKWLELSLKIEPDLLDYASRLFVRFGYQRHIVIERAETNDETIPAILQTYLPADEFAQGLIDRLTERLGNLAALRPLESLYIIERSAEYWNNLWEEPSLFRVGQRIILMPDRKNYQAAPDEILIEIPPSLEIFSLGPGGPHPTTSLSLRLMEKHLDPTLHKKMLDLGTGSGVLALVAVHLGIERILALDAHLPAVKVAREMVARNGMTNQVTVEAGSLAVRPKSAAAVYAFEEETQQPPAVLAEWLPFDAIVCNTYHHVLINLADALKEALRPGGLLISSGVLEQKAGEVASAFEAAGFQLLERQDEDTWVGFAHVRI